MSMEKAFPTENGLQQPTGGSMPRLIVVRGTAMKYEQYDTMYSNNVCGSWAPLDTNQHWRWNNPLNLLLALPGLLLALGLLAGL